MWWSKYNPKLCFEQSSTTQHPSHVSTKPKIEHAVLLDILSNISSEIYILSLVIDYIAKINNCMFCMTTSFIVLKGIPRHWSWCQYPHWIGNKSIQYTHSCCHPSTFYSIWCSSCLIELEHLLTKCDQVETLQLCSWYGCLLQ